MTLERRGHPTEVVLATFSVPSVAGNERQVLARVAEAVADCGLTQDALDRLKTASAETAMNAIEHGNLEQAEVPVEVVVSRGAAEVTVEITDRGGGRHEPADVPDLELKLAGLQTPRGWGLFLIQNLVDALEERTEGELHTVRLSMLLAPPADPQPADGGPA